MLTSTPSESASAPRHRLTLSGRVGPYELVREVVRAPGCVIAEARDADGEPRLLQLTRLRSVLGDQERAERQRQEKLAAQRTAELVSAGILSISAHGGADVELGERVLFWALASSDLPFLIERLDERPLASSDLALLGAALARRLAARHAADRTDPLLVEHLVRVSPSGEPDVVGEPELFGAPVAIPSEWLAPSVLPPRLAPEELRAGTWTASGDVWRLGKLLGALHARAPEPSGELRACIEALSADLVSERVPSAVRAEELLRAIAGGGERSLGARPALIDHHPFAGLLASQTDPAWAPPRRSSSQTAPALGFAGESPTIDERKERSIPAELELGDERGRSTEIVEGRRPTELASDRSASAPTAPVEVARPIDRLPELSLPDPFAQSSWDIEPMSPPTTSEVTAGDAPTPVLGVAAPTVEAVTVRAEAYLGSPLLGDPEAVTRQSEPETPVPELVRPVLFDRTESEAVTGEAEARAPGGDRARPILIDRTEHHGEARDPAAAPHGAGPVRPDRTERVEIPDSADRTIRLSRSVLEAPTDPPRVSLSGAYEALGVSDTVVEPARGPAPSAAAVIHAVDPTSTPSTERMEAEPLVAPDPVVAQESEPRPADPAALGSEATLPDGTRADALSGSARNGRAEGASREGRTSDPPRPAIDPIAASWAQPVLPAGESPWSEVVHPRGTHTRDRGEFPGFDGELPLAPGRPEKRAQPIEVESRPSYPSPAPYKEVQTSEIEVELAEALRGFDKRKIVSAVLVALVIFGLFALLSRTGREPAGREVLVATPANEVALESEPVGATVVSEADGEILGKTPLRFLVAPGSGAAVYLVSTGREPLRLSLPERGGLMAKLVPLAGSECVVKLAGVEGVEIEGVEVDIGANVERRIPGAALVRAKPGQRVRGARLVRCPELGGPKEPRLELERRTSAVLVRVTAPDGATAYLNGDPLGNVPAVGRASTAFSVVRVDDPRGGSEERLVPSPSEIEIKMPAARARPSARLLAGEAAEAEAEKTAAEVEKKDERDGERPEAADAKETTRSAPETKNAPAKPKLEKAQRVIRARSLLKQGSKALSAGRISAAKESLIECVDLDPDAAECHKMLGMLYRRARSTFKAREHFTRYLELSPEAPDAAKIRKMIEQ